MSTPTEPLRLDLPPMGLRPCVLFMAGGGLAFLIAGFAFGIPLLTILPNPANIITPILLPLPGAYCLLSAFLLAVRRTTLLASPGQLQIINSTLGVKRRRTFPPQSLSNLALTIRRGSSDAFSIATLYAALPNGKRKNLLSRYGVTEMQRLTEALRAALWPDRTLDHSNPLLPPPGGYLVVTPHAQNLAFHMNPEPTGQVLAGTYYIGLVLALAFPVFATFLITLAFLTHQSPETILIASFMLPMIALIMISIGIALATWAKRVAARQADILLTADHLQIDITGPGAPAHFRWPRVDITAIAVAPGKLSLNNQSIQQLNISLRTGATASLFAGRDVEDLRYLAQTLHNALQLPDPAQLRTQLLHALATSTMSPAATLPANPQLQSLDDALQNSNLHRIPPSDKIILRIEPLGFRRVSLPAFFFACLFTLAGLFPIALLFFPPSNDPLPVAPILTFALILLIMPVFVFYRAYRAAHATAQIEITAADLILQWDGAFTTRRLKIPCEKISAIKAGWHSAGDSQSFNLQFHLTDQSTQTALDGFTEKELQTLATALQKALALPPS